MRGPRSIPTGGNIFHYFFLFSGSKASDANIGIIAILVHFEKKSNVPVLNILLCQSVDYIVLNSIAVPRGAYQTRGVPKCCTGVTFLFPQYSTAILCRTKQEVEFMYVPGSCVVRAKWFTVQLTGVHKWVFRLCMPLMFTGIRSHTSMLHRVSYILDEHFTRKFK